MVYDHIIVPCCCTMTQFKLLIIKGPLNSYVVSCDCSSLTFSDVSMLFSAGGNRKDKSLRIMSQKFVMLFLVSKTQTVTLDAAAKILIEESQDSSSHSKYKSKRQSTKEYVLP